jgi:hypothetical protein
MKDDNLNYREDNKAGQYSLHKKYLRGLFDKGV